MTDLDLTAAAAEIGMSREWLRKKVTAEEVECQRYGRSIRFTPEQIAKIRAKHTQPIARAITPGGVRLVAVPTAGRPSPPPPTPPPPPRPTAPPKATTRKATA